MALVTSRSDVVIFLPGFCVLWDCATPPGLWGWGGILTPGRSLRSLYPGLTIVKGLRPFVPGFSSATASNLPPKKSAPRLLVAPCYFFRIQHYWACAGTESHRGYWSCRSRTAQGARNQDRIRCEELYRSDEYQDTTTYPSSGY